MNVTTLKDTLVARRLALNPWTGFYFLQSLLINLALGYEFSLLYTVAFTCVLHLLWRAFPRVQKAVVGAYSLLAALYYPFGQAYGAPNFNTLLALHATNVEESTEILTIFPCTTICWRSSSSLSGSLRFVVGSLSHHAGEKWIRWACCSASGSSFSSRCKTLLGRCIQGD